MKRRTFLGAIGAAAAWPLGARAQSSAVPVIGFLHPTSLEKYAHLVAAFRRGLSDVGFVEGQNVRIEYRWAHDELGRLPQLAEELVHGGVTVIATPGSTPASLAAKAATSTIPIVFAIGVDPVQAGLVKALARPVGNITGVSYLQADLGTKRVGLLHSLLPNVQRLGAIVNPENATATAAVKKTYQIAGHSIGREIETFAVANGSEIEAVFAQVRGQRIDAMLVNADPLFFSLRDRIVSLAAAYKLPTIYPNREYPDAGGLMSYGPNLVGQFHQAGLYTGRVLKGEKPVDLPVLQSSRFEFVINAKAAKLLGLEFHPQLLATADEVVE